MRKRIRIYLTKADRTWQIIKLKIEKPMMSNLKKLFFQLVGYKYINPIVKKIKMERAPGRGVVAKGR